LVELSEIQAAYYMVAATGVLVAAVYYILNMRATLQTRQAQLFMHLYDRMSQPELSAIINNIRYNLKWSDPDDFWRKYGAETNLEEYSKIASAGNYFKGIGVLLKKRLIDRMFIYDLLSSPLKVYWERMGPVILERRRVTSNPNLFAFVDYLYDEMVKVDVELSTKST
jgi:hypothetical protein